MNSRKDTLRLTDLLMGKNLVLELWSENANEIQAFKEACYEFLGRDTQWFHQCNCEDYQMFELWINPDKFDLVEERCQLVAKEITKPLIIEMSESAGPVPA